MKRKIAVLLATVAVLAGFGAVLHSPPSFMDTVTGATPRAKKAAQESARLKGEYIFCMNSSADGLEDRAVRTQVKNIVSGKTDTLQTDGKKKEKSSGSTEIKFHIYVSDSNYALKKYAKTLCSRLNQAGADVEVREYNNIMLRSRICSGRYQAFLISEDLLDAATWKQADALVLNSKEMEAESVPVVTVERSSNGLSKRSKEG